MGRPTQIYASTLSRREHRRRRGRGRGARGLALTVALALAGALTVLAAVVPSMVA